MSDTTNKPQGPEGFLVVLPHTIIEIPLSSNLSWLPLFYALPPELVNKRPEYAEFPRQYQYPLIIRSSQEYGRKRFVRGACVGLLCLVHLAISQSAAEERHLS